MYGFWQIADFSKPIRFRKFVRTLENCTDFSKNPADFENSCGFWQIVQIFLKTLRILKIHADFGKLCRFLKKPCEF